MEAAFDPIRSDGRFCDLAARVDPYARAIGVAE
jgi:hypothetical protein